MHGSRNPKALCTVHDGPRTPKDTGGALTLDFCSERCGWYKLGPQLGQRGCTWLPGAQAAGGEVLEEIEESKAFFEVYDGAVYLYQVPPSFTSILICILTALC